MGFCRVRVSASRNSGEWKGDNGLIYKIKPGGQGEVWTREMHTFPNGMCLGPDGDFLYVAMSLNPPRVVRIRIQANGSAGPVDTVGRDALGQKR